MKMWGAILSIIALSSLVGCAYQFGYQQRSLPGGYKKVAIPMFKNLSDQVDAERYFTEALVSDFDRSRVAKVVDKNQAPIVIDGTITSITYTPDAYIYAGNPESNTIDLPVNTVLASSYRCSVDVNIKIRRTSDHKIIWQGNFNDEREYQAPQIGLPVINSADALYNHSAHNQVVEELANDMMQTAHDRITENF